MGVPLKKSLGKSLQNPASHIIPSRSLNDNIFDDPKCAFQLVQRGVTSTTVMEDYQSIQMPMDVYPVSAIHLVGEVTVLLHLNTSQFSSAPQPKSLRGILHFFL